MRGYQTTAHFLAYLERRYPGAVSAIGRSLSDGSYVPKRFQDLTGVPLYRLVDRYEADHDLPDRATSRS